MRPMSIFGFVIALFVVGVFAARVPTSAKAHAGQTAIDAADGHAQDRDSLQLTAVSVKGTVSTPDSFEIEYFVRNLGGPVHFDNDPRFIMVDVLDPSGKLLESTRANFEPPVLGDLVELTLPRGGIVGRRMNLSCVSIAGGYAEHPRSPGKCDWRYTLVARGEYRVVLKYVHAGTGLRLESDTTRILYAPAR